MRKNNVNDMTIMEQVNVIVEGICDNYCKYHDRYNIKTKEEDEEFQEICEKCPLRKFGV